MSKIDKMIDCPNCAESIKADAILCRFCQSGLSTDHFSECPYCSEMVRKDVALCRYCKTSIVGRKAMAGQSPSPMRKSTSLIEPFRQPSSADIERIDRRDE